MTLDIDTIYKTLSNNRRRFVLYALREREELTVRELTGFVAAAEYDCAETDLTYKQRKRVYTSLVQSHLPTLASYGIIDYEKDRGTVRRRPAVDDVEAYLDGPTPGETEGGHVRPIAFSALFGALTVLLYANVPVVTDLTALGVTLAATLGFGAIAISRVVRGRTPTDETPVPETTNRFHAEDDTASGRQLTSLLFFWR